MRRNLNKLTRVLIQNFLVKANTGNITPTEFGYSMNLFAHLDDQKHVVGYLMSKGLDPFKKGTKEPQKIADELLKAKWYAVKYAPQAGSSPFDNM